MIRARQTSWRDRGWEREYLISYETEDVGDEDFFPEASDKSLHR